MILDLQQFIVTERPRWDELEALLHRVEEDPGQRLSLEQTRRFHYLYDRAASDLLRISTFASSPEIVTYLENLVARAYGEIHETREPRQRFLFRRWLSRELPQTFRRHLHAFWLSLGLTVLGAVLGAGILRLDPDAKESILPFSHLMGKPSERVAEEEKNQGKHLEGVKATFAGSLMTHNISVSLMTLAMGMTYGFGTVVLVFYNGVILGAVSYDYIQDGQTWFLLGWLLPHGSVEIPSVMIAAQAGFVLAGALIGSRQRLSLRDRLAAVRSDLVTLICGFSLLLVWAGIVEAFFSQYHEPVLPYGVKIAFGLMELVGLFSYLTFSGRKPEKKESLP
jgi:uncharacterized membrane protein SpoIIM required for sporulation